MLVHQRVYEVFDHLRSRLGIAGPLRSLVYAQGAQGPHRWMAGPGDLAGSFGKTTGESRGYHGLSLPSGELT